MRRTSLVFATLAAAAMGVAFASTALADCGANHEAMSKPNTTASTSSPTQQQQQHAPGTNG